MRYVLGFVLVLGLTVAIVGCGDSSKPVEAKKDSGPSEAIPASLMTSASPSGAKDLSVLKASAKDGDEVVMRARVGGTEKPLSESRAIMTVADLSLPTCDKTPMDTCKTPWDSCCEPREKLTANTATVEVPGADGKPLRATLNGVSGIAPGKQIVVTGVAKTTAGTLVVEAKQIYVVP